MNEPANRFVTISVDDGHPTDMRSVHLLQKYGLQATFYIPGRNPERPVMSAPEIRELARQFEVGGHTLNHTPLKGLSSEKAWNEIHDGKQWLEDLLGQAVISFCYPRGKFDGSVVGLVKKAGFLGARTCLFNLHNFPRNPFLWGVSTHAYHHSATIQIRHALLERNFAGAWSFFRDYKGATDWRTQFHHGLDHVERHGGIAHLYFHSWEIDEAGEWEILESVLDTIARRKLTTVTNGALFQLWNTRQQNARTN